MCSNKHLLVWQHYSPKSPSVLNRFYLHSLCAHQTASAASPQSEWPCSCSAQDFRDDVSLQLLLYLSGVTPSTHVAWRERKYAELNAVGWGACEGLKQELGERRGLGQAGVNRGRRNQAWRNRVRIFNCHSRLPYRIWNWTQESWVLLFLCYQQTSVKSTAKVRVASSYMAGPYKIMIYYCWKWLLAQVAKRSVLI